MVHQTGRIARQIGALLLIAGLAFGGVAACGKEGAPKPPSGNDDLYPRTYPKGSSS